MENSASAGERQRQGRDVSDAGSEVVELQLRDREPYDELPARAHLPLRADRPVGDLVAAVENALDRLISF